MWLNLASLGAYGGTLVVVFTPLMNLFRTSGFFSGYEPLGVLIVGGGLGGTLAQAAAILTLLHLIRERRWTWDLSLTLVTAVLLPAALVGWAVAAG